MWPLILLLLGICLWYLALRMRSATGLPAGRVVYADTGAWVRPEKALVSTALGLTGKLDYLVRQNGLCVPVEVKSGRAPDEGPHPAHVFQLAAYCALVAEAYGTRPRHGMIKYSDRTLAVDFTPNLEAQLQAVLKRMRVDRQALEVHRSHEAAARCRGCGFRDVCAEDLT